MYSSAKFRQPGFFEIKSYLRDMGRSVRRGRQGAKVFTDSRLCCNFRVTAYFFFVIDLITNAFGAADH